MMGKDEHVAEQTYYTGAEQARFQPPPCPKCGSRDVIVHWQDATSERDEERMFFPGMFECRPCEAALRGEVSGGSSA